MPLLKMRNRFFVKQRRFIRDAKYGQEDAIKIKFAKKEYKNFLVAFCNILPKLKKSATVYPKKRNNKCKKKAVSLQN